MKGKKIRSLASAIFIVSFVFVTACSNAGSNATAEEEIGDRTSHEGNTNTQDGTVIKYDPPIELTTVRQMSSSAKYGEGEDNDKNVWTDMFEEELGIKLKYLWVTEDLQATYNTKLNVTITSGDLPDYFRVNATQLQQLYENDQIADLTELYEKYASKELKEIFGNAGDALAQSSVGDALIALPELNYAMDRSNMLWIRTDWLEALNLSEPTSLEDVFAVASAFSKQDPDGNGADDTFGLGLMKDIFIDIGNVNGIINGHHGYQGIWVEDGSGKLVYGSIQPEVKQALGRISELYQAGAIDKEFSVTDRKKLIENVTAGKIGMLYGPMHAPITTFQGLYNLNPKSDWKPFPLPSIDGQPAKAQLPLDAMGFYVVSKHAKHPEALILLMNKFVEKFQNQKPGEPYFKESASHLVTNINVLPPSKNLENYRAQMKADATGDTSGFNFEQLDTRDKLKQFVEGGNAAFWFVPKVFGAGGSFSVVDYYDKSDLFQRNKFNGAPTETMKERWASLQQLEVETFTKIVMGAAEANEFEKFVESWHKLGGEQITQEVNAWYAKK
ncbi:ABC transporter substrate-binding protein [Paenibacillus sp.]|uniref:ABC transporter substrate-binding protein n=1 Tax=Paenibacillus sp. TaxID=58172 RepID=UPI002D236A8B|nr:ABC transporter substrate-binding protein [Paenibacillus sp.]HZG55649.1 ABC transporter substrate-binding protein [Paenibacillus sp.]